MLTFGSHLNEKLSRKRFVEHLFEHEVSIFLLSKIKLDDMQQDATNKIKCLLETIP